MKRTPAEAIAAAGVDPKIGAQPETGALASSAPIVQRALVACPDCDLAQRLPELHPGQSARCPRCGAELRRRRRDSINRTLALALAAAVLCVVANCVPMLGLSAAGQESFTTITGGAVKLWQNGQQIVAGLVFFAAVIAPALQITFLLIVLTGAQRSPAPAWLGTILRHHPFTRTWSMLEVLLLGVLVALTKIAEFATVEPGLALFAVGGLVAVTAAMQSSFDPQEIWDRVEWQNAGAGASAVRAVKGQTP
jgi:paraquat-inducible protein A